MKTYKIYYSYNELPDNWDHLVSHDIFLTSHYLKALEEASPANIQLFYFGIFNKNELIGAAIVQRVQLYLKDMFRQTKVSCLKEFVRNTISKVLKGNMLVVGNMTQTGQHGMFFNSDKISQNDYLNIVFEGVEALKKQIKEKQHKHIRAIMLKDFFEDDGIHEAHTFFENQRLYKVKVQPNMAMSIRAHWIKMEDYVGDFNKKYRDRYKRARKKLEKITCRELDVETIEKSSGVLHKYYLNVSNNAKFNTFLLPENHFCKLKSELKESFKVYGYYSENELIGFFSLILNDKHLETYFLGYDEAHQYPNQLYLNMLYDMANFAIENKFNYVVYARTAMEIKSSVGAKPKQMVIYLKHTNSLLNAVLKYVFNLMDPTQKWEERHPFG